MTSYSPTSLQTSLSDAVLAATSLYVASQLPENAFARVHFAMVGIAACVGTLKFASDHLNATTSTLVFLHRWMSFLASLSHLQLLIGFCVQQALRFKLGSFATSAALLAENYFTFVNVALFTAFSALFIALRTEARRQPWFITIPGLCLLSMMYMSGFSTPVVATSLAIIVFGLGSGRLSANQKIGSLYLTPPIVLHYALAVLQLCWLWYCF